MGVSRLSWWKVILMTPSAPTVGRPDVAPEPAAFATPSSVVPLGVFVPTASVAAPAASPVASPPPASLFPPSAPPVSLSRRPRLSLAAAVAPLLMNLATAASASTVPPEGVFPNGDPFLRMIEVSASAPQAGLLRSVTKHDDVGQDIIPCAVTRSAINDT